MRLANLLEQKKTAIVRNWFDLVVQTYPADTSRFLKTQKDPFANPVGKTVRHGLEALFDILLKGLDPETISSFLDPIIRIRAVQDFSPSQAVSFIFSLKQIIRNSLESELRDELIWTELLKLELTIDELGLIAFDIYMECREKIYQIQANEMKTRTFSAFKRAGLVSDIP